MSNYEYEVEEYSQDTRTFTLESNKKLPQEVVERVYYSKCGLNDSDVDIEHDITEDVYNVLEDYIYCEHSSCDSLTAKDFEGLKVTTRFAGTVHGDNSEVESSGEFL
jgi:hypothetical protein